MSHHLIVVVNRSLARFFTLEPVEFPELASGPRITACCELENADIKEGQEMFSDSKTGRGAAPSGGGVHGYDDKRDHHLDELRRRFAIKVLSRIHTLAEEKDPRDIILISSARMRRFLYPELDRLTHQGRRVHKLSKNMINFSPLKIHMYLAECGLAPKQK